MDFTDMNSLLGRKCSASLYQRSGRTFVKKWDSVDEPLRVQSRNHGAGASKKWRNVLFGDAFVSSCSQKRNGDADETVSGGGSEWRQSPRRQAIRLPRDASATLSVNF